MTGGHEPGALPKLNAQNAMGLQAGGGNIQYNHYYAQTSTGLVFPLGRCQVGVVPLLADCHQDREVAHVFAACGPVVPCWVLVGPGGAGKTQLAASLARQLWDERKVDLLIWGTATSRSGIVTRFAQAAADATGVHDLDPEEAAVRFLAWLATTDSRWLIVLDDLTEPADMTGLWPPGSASGQTVVTTRRRDAALLAGRAHLDVGMYTPAEAHRYLDAKLGGARERLEEVDTLAAELEYLPLALAQAAAYIADQGLTCADYRRRLARRKLADLTPDALPDDHGVALYATWSMSIGLADRLSPRKVARPVLEVAALLDPNAIPITLLAAAAVADYCAMRVGRPVDADDAHDAVRLLHRLNLATVDDATGTLRMHALVQRVVREDLAALSEPARAAIAADALMEIWPDVERDRSHSQMLRSNAASLLSYAGTELMTCHDRVHQMLFRVGRSLGSCGMVAAAVSHFGQLYANALQHFGPDHPDTLEARSELANWRGQAGDRTGAAAALRALFTDRKLVLGADHPDTLKTQHDHAHWSGHAGDAASAVSGLGIVLSAQLRILGPDHPDTLTSRGNLAHWRGETGDAAGAAAAIQELLADRLRVLGPDHPRTLITRMSLAFWRGQAGDAAGAVSALEPLLADQSRILGLEHPDTFTTRSNIAHWRGQAGDSSGAVNAFADLLRDRLTILGPDHPRTLITRSNLAHWQGQAGNANGAFAALEALLADQVRVLGPDDPQTLGTRASLAYWQGQAGDVTSAADAFEELLADQNRVLGPDHHDTRTTHEAIRQWQAGVDENMAENAPAAYGKWSGRRRHVSE